MGEAITDALETKTAGGEEGDARAFHVLTVKRLAIA